MQKKTKNIVLICLLKKEASIIIANLFNNKIKYN